MGQYYKPTLITKKGSIITFSSWDYGVGLKLMEHSYFNNFLKAVSTELYNNPCKVFWMGDYTKVEDLSNHPEITEKFLKDISYGIYNKTPYSEEELINPRYLVNLDKKVYIDLMACKDDSLYEKMHPLPLLTATGNGRGGGCYRGVNEEDIGIWAGDTLYTSDKEPSKEFTRVYDFTDIDIYGDKGE